MVDTSEQGGLARAGRPEDRDHFALADVEVNAVEDRLVAECLDEIVDLDSVRVVEVSSHGEPAFEYPVSGEEGGVFSAFFVVRSLA